MFFLHSERMRIPMKKITTGLILILLITCFFSATAFADVTLTFDSQELYFKMKTGGGFPLPHTFNDANKELTYSDADANLFSTYAKVELGTSNITSLTLNDLQQFDKLSIQGLDLEFNSINDISNLSNLIDSGGLKNLSFLDIRGNNIMNFGNLENSGIATVEIRGQNMTITTPQTTGIVLPYYVSEYLIPGSFFHGPINGYTRNIVPTNCTSTDGYKTLDLTNVGGAGVTHTLFLQNGTDTSLNGTTLTIIHDPSAPIPAPILRPGSQTGSASSHSQPVAAKVERDVFYNVWESNTNYDGYTFVSDGPFAKFEGIWIHGFAISPSNYTASVGEDGSTVVTLKQSFVNSISDSKDILLHLVFSDGYGVTKFNK